MKNNQCIQREFAFTNWGGKRRGAGRKPKGERAGVSHAKRPKLTRHQPVLVTLKLGRGLPWLRDRLAHRAVAQALAEGTKEDFRVVEYSVQNDHLHLLAEAEDERTLSRWMKGLVVRLARALNRLWKRIGNVFPDRYHSRILTSPRAVRIALVYVLSNARKHGAWHEPKPDIFSSGRSFDGWKGSSFFADSSPRLLERARSWLLSKGWRRHGLLDPLERPAT